MLVKNSQPTIPFKAPRAYTLSLREEKSLQESLRRLLNYFLPCLQFLANAFTVDRSNTLDCDACYYWYSNPIILQGKLKILFSLQQRSQVFVFERGKIVMIMQSEEIFKWWKSKFTFLTHILSTLTCCWIIILIEGNLNVKQHQKTRIFT